MRICVCLFFERVANALLISFFCLFFILAESFASNKNYVIDGYIEDNLTGERLVAASIYHIENSIGTTSNNYGFFSLTVPYGKTTIVISYLGYSKTYLEFNIRNDTSIVIGLEPTKLEINELTVSALRNKGEVYTPNCLRLDIKEAVKFPVLLGERDILKTYQLLPGVQYGIEGTTGMIIRGSDPGQNLILLDGVPVYNINHLFGLFSVFNTDAIKSSSLFKGNLPARYGGRVASVLEIQMKEGNLREMKGSASIGLLSARVLLEGPIIKDKTAFLISCRRSYIDLFSYPYFKWILKENSIWSYKLYDLNIKLNHILNKKNRLYLSLYSGRDNYKYKFREESISLSNNGRIVFNERHGFAWGNKTGTLRWNHQYGNRLFSNLIFILSDYKFKTLSEIEETFLGENPTYNKLTKNYNSGIIDLGSKIDFDYRPNNRHNILFGGTIIQHLFQPGISVSDFSGFEELLKLDSSNIKKSLTNLELATYIEDNVTVSSRILLNLGLRYSLYIADESIYKFIEPRFSINLIPHNRHHLSFGYFRTSQPIHLLVNSSIGFPSDLWVPVTKTIKPIIGEQIDFTYKFLLSNHYSLTIASYYKDLSNVIEYKENADLKLDWQSIVEQGKGEAFGIEILVKKSNPKLSGWISYTLSKSSRQFTAINNGAKFPYKYDRRHAIKIVGLYKMNKEVSVSFSWIFNSGHAVTLPLEIYAKDNTSAYFGAYFYSPEILDYDTRNGFRMPSYHRLDFSIDFYKEKKRYNRTLSIGLYNAYWRKNAFYLDFYQGKLRGHGIVPIVPSVNYAISF